MALLDDTPASFEEYAAAGGGKGLERALGREPDALIDAVLRSGLRGRGGAGFPTGRKWRSLRDSGTGPDFVCNAAEGEPATFKDRLLMRRNPYQVIEGLAIAVYAVGAQRGVIGLKRVFETEAGALSAAIEEMHAAGALAETPIELAFGPDHFLTGEETGPDGDPVRVYTPRRRKVEAVGEAGPVRWAPKSGTTCTDQPDLESYVSLAWQPGEQAVMPGYLAGVPEADPTGSGLVIDMTRDSWEIHQGEPEPLTVTY
jgi:hypothetical protein